MESIICLRIIELGMLALAYEWWMVYSDRWNMTISALVMTEAEKGRFAVILVSLVFGILIGHFCWPQYVTVGHRQEVDTVVPDEMPQDGLGGGL